MHRLRDAASQLPDAASKPVADAAVPHVRSDAAPESPALMDGAAPYRDGAVDIRHGAPDIRDGAPWSPRDAGELDAAPVSDAGPDDAGSCQDSLAPTMIAPARLSEAGLYTDIVAKTLAPWVSAFSPQFVLWSDGAEKTRFMYLPECGAIDTSDMDDWSFPVGTRAFKEFALDGKRIETRLVHRYGSGVDDFLFAHYLWNDDESEATLIDLTVSPEVLHNPKGTDYTVPTPDTCPRCHGASGGEEGGLRSRFLGFSAVQLSHHGPGTTLTSLVEANKLSRPPVAPYVVPGTPVERAALGLLHANCGFCHNLGPEGVAFPASPMSLLLSTHDRTVWSTGAYTTVVGVEVIGFEGLCTHRLLPQDPGLLEVPSGPVQSCIFQRMASRVPGEQMPPLATKRVHAQGLLTIEAWVRQLAK